MICMKNLRFSSCLRANVRCQGPPGSARAQPCHLYSFQRGVLVRHGLCRSGPSFILLSINMDASCTSSPCSFFTTCWADRTFVLLIASQSASGDNSSLHLTTHLDLFMTNVKLMTPLTFSSSSSHSFLVTC